MTFLFLLTINVDPKWTRTFPHPSKTLKLWKLAISPKLFKSDERFMARSKEDNQGFRFDF